MELMGPTKSAPHFMNGSASKLVTSWTSPVFAMPPTLGICHKYKSYLQHPCVELATNI